MERLTRPDWWWRRGWRRQSVNPKMNVHILATCRKLELLPYTTLVFETLRVGFPTAKVFVTINNIPPECGRQAVLDCITKVGAGFDDDNTIHHEWIDKLIQTEQEPFWVCDTDLIFFDSFENVTSDSPLTGWCIPEWQDEFSGAITRSRLHPSLLRIDPKLVKEKLAAFRSVTPDTPFTPFCNPVYPICLPFNGRMYFHDTLSLLYHAIGGQPFTDEQLDNYFHFNFGTIPDIVIPRLSGSRKMVEAREMVMANPRLGRGAWRNQQDYYASREPVFDGSEEVAPISAEDAKSAREWNIRLCKGDREAMEFNDLWYKYVHAIDDLIDTMVDGRPKMTRDEIIQIFYNAAGFYNCAFFVKHRVLLFPIVVSVTNSYANSVSWERSPFARRRLMADVWRTCGDEMYDMVAMIVGGWQHVREMSPLIRDRDWIGQHDES